MRLRTELQIGPEYEWSEEEELSDRGVQAPGHGGSEIRRENLEDSGACDSRDLQSQC